MNIRIITVGDQPNKAVSGEIETYQKRLPAHVKLTWHYIKHATADRSKSLRDEQKAIEKAILPRSKVILLDEFGKQMTSEEVALTFFASPQDLSLIIGGAYGVTDELKTRADIVWSLSKLVFPHQLVRLLLAEQIYRAHAIHTAHPYHHA